MICSVCKKASTKFDPFMDLSLEIPSTKTSLAECYRHFTAHEVPSFLSLGFSDYQALDGDDKFQCENCKKKVKAFKKVSIYR